MKILNNYEMMEIKGGGINVKLAVIFGGLLTFLAGFVDGIIHPKKCG